MKWWMVLAWILMPPAVICFVKIASPPAHAQAPPSVNSNGHLRMDGEIDSVAKYCDTKNGAAIYIHKGGMDSGRAIAILPGGCR